MTNILRRASGVLLHPTSLPGPYAIGDLGGEARTFVDFLVEIGQTLWQNFAAESNWVRQLALQCALSFLPAILCLLARSCSSMKIAGTHDNDTTAGWFEKLSESKEPKSERDFCLRYLDSEGKEIHWDLIRAALASVAETAIIPLQDLLGLGSEARMNLPASESDNWLWRYRADALTETIATRLGEMTTLYGRANQRTE